MGLLLGDVGQNAAVVTGLTEQCVPQAPTLLAYLYWVGLTLDRWDFLQVLLPPMLPLAIHHHTPGLYMF